MIELARRQVIAGGIAGGLAVLVPAVARANGLQPLRAFFFDERFGPSSAEARAHRAAGVAVFDGRRDDLGRVWRRDMPALLAGASAVAGLTPWSDLLIAELSARNLGLRLEYHRQLARGLHAWSLRRS
jgi:hypothetical protein